MHKLRLKASKMILSLFLISAIIGGMFAVPSFGAGRTIKIMPVGDSCTEGMGDPDMGGYRTELYRLYTEAGLSIDFVGSNRRGPNSLPDKDNEGHSGWTIPQIASNIDNWLNTYNPDVVLLWIGGNDVLLGGNVNTTGLSNLIDQIFRTKPNVTIFVADYYPWPEQIKQYNATIPGVVQQKASAGKRVYFVKLSDMQFSPNVDLSSDGLHLNVNGYSKIARIWFNSTINILREMAGTPDTQPNPTPTPVPGNDFPFPWFGTPTPTPAPGNDFPFPWFGTPTPTPAPGNNFPFPIPGDFPFPWFGSPTPAPNFPTPTPYIPTSGSGKTIKIMPVGDSCTEGMGDPDMGGYRTELYRLYKEAGLNFDFVGSNQRGPSSLPDRDNEGHSGWTIPQIAGNIDNWLNTYNPDVVLLWIGGNDVLQGRVNTEGLSNLIDQIFRTKPNVTIFVADYYPWPEQVKQYNATIPGVVQQKANAGKKVYFVKLSDVQFSSYVDLSSDGLHLNVNGYKKIAKIWFDSTINILKELAGTPNTQPTPTPGSGVKKGDINGDGEVNSIDYALLKRYLVGMDSTLPTPNGYAAADINGDGDINSIDYANLKLILLGMSN